MPIIIYNNTKKVIIDTKISAPTQIILLSQSIYDHSTVSRDSKLSTSHSMSSMSAKPENSVQGRALMIHRNKHGGKFRSTASDIVLNNKKTLFAVGIEFLN